MKDTIILSAAIVFVGFCTFFLVTFPEKVNELLSNLFNTTGNSIPILFGIGFLILIFLALREFFCWYWKINKRIDLLQQIERNTRKSEEIKTPAEQKV